MASTLKNPFGVFITRGDGQHSLNEVSGFRFEQEAIPSWNDMKAVVKAQFDVENPIVLKYIDSDQEEVTIGSQEEWLLAIQAAEKDSNQLVLRFSVLAKEAKPSKEEKQTGKAHKQSKTERTGAKFKKTQIACHLQNIHSKVEDLSKELSTVKLTQQQQFEEIKRHAPSAPASSSSLARASVTHEGVLCSVCRRVLQGARFKCANCADFNLCAVCEKALPSPCHPRNHIFLKILIPLDHDVDAALANHPVVAFDFYKRRSVNEFVRHVRHARHRRRSSSSSSSSSSGSSSTSSTSSSRSRRRRRHRQRDNEKRIHMSCSSTCGRNCRHKQRLRRRHRSSSNSGSSSTSDSPSVITLDVCGGTTKRRRCSEACSAPSCSFDRNRKHHSHHHKHHRHPHVHRWHRHSHRRPHAGDTQRRLMDWAAGEVEGSSIEAERDGDAETVMMSENEMSRFRKRLNQLSCAPEADSLTVEAAVEEQEAPKRKGSEEYFVQTGCGLGEWVAVDGENSVLPTDCTLMEDAESVRQVESLPDAEEVDVEVVGENQAPSPVICLDSETEDCEEKKTEEEDKKRAEPLIDLDEEERGEETKIAPKENPQPQYPYPKADCSQMASQQQQQWMYSQYAPGVFHYPVATVVQTPAPTTEAPAASAPPSSAPAPVYPYPNYPPVPVNGPAHAGMWNATVNAANGFVQALHSGWAAPAAQPAPPTGNYPQAADREMQQLLEMGFCNRDQNRALLQKHKNNVQEVVAELIGHMNDGWAACRH